MTPLAARLLKLALERKDKALMKLLDDIHCFEITAAIPLMREVRYTLRTKMDEIDDYNYVSKTILEKVIFLPAPHTWIEHLSVNRPGIRVAYLCSEQPELSEVAASDQEWQECKKEMGISDSKDKLISVNWMSEREGLFIGVLSSTGMFRWMCDRIPDEVAERPDLFSKYNPDGTQPALPEMNPRDWANSLLTNIPFMLAMINSPKIIGAKTIMPHRGLERRLLKNQDWVGKFPLHAWTEIHLRVTKPVEIDDGEPHEAHLTGRRALHFVRKHLRIRLGQLEYVSAHWRGDPAIGIKRSRYKVTP